VKANDDEDAIPHRSWWRSVYRRLSRSGSRKADDLPTKRENSYSHRFGHRSHSRYRPSFRSGRPPILSRRQEYEYADSPPSAFNRISRDNQHIRDESATPTVATVGHQRHDTDVLTPLTTDHERHYRYAGATQPFPAPIRGDSVLCRVFSHESPMASPVQYENEGAHDLLQPQAQLRPSKAQSLATQLLLMNNEAQVANEAEAGILCTTPEPHAENVGPVFRRLHRRESAFVRFSPPSPSCSVPGVGSQVDSGPILSHDHPSSDQLYRAPSTSRNVQPRVSSVPKSPKPLTWKRTSGTRHSKKSPDSSNDFSQSPGGLRQRSLITDQPTAPEAAKLQHAIVENTIDLPPPILPMSSANTTVPPPRPRRLAPVRANRPPIHGVSQPTSNRSPDGDRTDEAPVFLGRQPRTPCTSLPVVFDSPARPRSLPQLLDSSSGSRYPSAQILNTPPFLSHNSANRW
jgi:hypothetical protein